MEAQTGGALGSERHLVLKAEQQLVNIDHPCSCSLFEIFFFFWIKAAPDLEDHPITLISGCTSDGCRFEMMEQIFSLDQTQVQAVAGFVTRSTFKSVSSLLVLHFKDKKST